MLFALLPESVAEEARSSKYYNNNPEEISVFLDKPEFFCLGTAVKGQLYVYSIFVILVVCVLVFKRQRKRHALVGCFSDMQLEISCFIIIRVYVPYVNLAWGYYPVPVA